MILAYGFAFAVAALLIVIVRRYADRFGLVDIPNERSLHTDIVPRGAGIGFFLSFFLTSALFYPSLLTGAPFTFVAIFAVFVVGILDDRHDTSPHTKFIVIFIGVFLLYLDGIYIGDLGYYWGVKLSLGWFALPFTMFAVSGFTNALNLIDGVDGLSSTVSMVILSAYAYIGYVHHDPFIWVCATLLLSVIAAFLIFNWHPASVFMGDSGSLTLGFLISVIAIKSLAYVPTVSVLFLAALPILDTLSVMIRRKKSGRSFFDPDKCHIHHVLLYYFNGRVRRTVLVLGGVQLSYSLIGLQLHDGVNEVWFLLFFLLNVIVLYRVMKSMTVRMKISC